jgi:O-antigen/teichoic acid export membrane protein
LALSRFRKNFISVLLTRGAQAVMAMCLGVLTARALGPSGKGIFVAVSNAAGMANMLGSLSLGQAIVYLIGKKEVAPDTVFGTTLIFWVMCSGEGYPLPIFCPYLSIYSLDVTKQFHFFCL